MIERGVAILGAGRMGQGIGLALARAGVPVFLVSRRAHAVTPPLVLHPEGRVDALGRASLVCLAVPDDGITPLAAELGDERAVGPHSVVLHLSGLLDRAALTPLAASGAGLGSFHPLQTIADPAAGPDRLAGAYAGIEGDGRALAAAEALAAALGMHTVRLDGAAKAVYHAGAVMAANYTVALAGVAERLAGSAGVPAQAAARIYLPLVRGAAANLELGPAVALTGPVRRGDAQTVAAHLAALDPADRVLYRRLGLEALRLAREAGLEPALAARVEA
ncbi:MAG TPA: Rossmann-like and DUF2520 domain-containing protein, partial [Gemmatimonadales bacterium]|nr:Rossmann-like and DUF2520 domain-containing protein [Gemmatimonadales bacterium]